MTSARQLTRLRALFGAPLKYMTMAQSLKVDGETVLTDALEPVRLDSMD